jgi:hypothetical protein
MLKQDKLPRLIFSRVKLNPFNPSKIEIVPIGSNIKQSITSVLGLKSFIFIIEKKLLNFKNAIFDHLTTLS